MSTFITSADYLPYIKDARLTQLIDATTGILDDAEASAIAVVRDALYSRYDCATIFATTGDTRPKQVVRWVAQIVLYYLHERLPDRMIPERVTKNYDDTLGHLEEISAGRKSTNLPLLPAPEGHANISLFRWGSNAQRGHNF